MTILNKITIFLIIILTSNGSVIAQGDFNLPGRQLDRIKFQLVNNLIVMPVELNGVKLSFLLDTGVSKPILFNITNTDSLQIKNVETIFLRGLGEGQSVRALKSEGNLLRIGNAINVNQDVYVVFDQNINFTARLGVPIHGIIGYDLFKNFVVDINYASKIIKFYKPSSYKYKSCKKCETFNLSFHNNKPYINASVAVDSIYQDVKLLIDTGSSDALWLFEDDALALKPYNNIFFKDYLGRGLSGNVYGKRSKAKNFKLKKFELNDVNVAFPDSTSISFARRHEERNGSISADILRRFNIVFDYNKAKITLKKNGYFKSPFQYNRSGIVLEQVGSRVVREKVKNNRPAASYGTDNENNLVINVSTQYSYELKPSFTIVELREGSPAKEVGLQVGDIIVSVNGKEAHTLKLQDVTSYFRNDVGRNIKLKVQRKDEILRFEFKLQDVFKQKELSN